MVPSVKCSFWCRSSVIPACPLLQGEFTKLDGLSFRAGSVIRCENKGHRWLVDGKLVVSSVASDDTMLCKFAV